MAAPLDLTAEAARLAAEVGPPPGRGPDQVAWQRRWDDAAEKLAELAGWDGAALRHALGLPVAVADSSPARDLLVLAGLSSDLKQSLSRMKKPRD